MSTLVTTLISLFGLGVLISLPIVLVLIIIRAQKSPTDSRSPRGGRSRPAAVRPDPHSPYERVPALLTAAERDFFVVLRQATPASHQLFAQVRLASLVQIKSSARRDKTHWYRIQAKCLDFVLVDSVTFAPCLVVELDDASHDRADRRARDAFVDDVLAATNIPILHVPWQRSYDAYVLAEQIAGKLQLTALPQEATQRHAAVSQAAPTLWKPIAAPTSTPSPAGTPQPVSAAQSPPSQPAVRLRHRCGQCQSELRPGARFCSSCGTVFSA